MAQGVRGFAHLENLLTDNRFIAQEKIDGVRAVVHITKEGLRIFSRSSGVQDPSRPLEKSSALPHLASLRFPELAGTIVDGEVLDPGKDSAEIAGAVHRKGNGRQNGNLKLFVFDIIRYRDTDLKTQPLYLRLSALLTLKAQLVSQHIVFLSYSASTPGKKRLYERVMREGKEGIVLKNLNGQYASGCRPANNWYKAKKQMSIDAIVMGFTQGKGKYNSRIGAVIFGQYVNGVLAEIGQASGMVNSVRADMSDHPEKYIGKVVTIKGMERLKSGAIRHPQFAFMRFDKNPKDCIYYPNEQ